MNREQTARLAAISRRLHQALEQTRAAAKAIADAERELLWVLQGHMECDPDAAFATAEAARDGAPELPDWPDGQWHDPADPPAWHGDEAEAELRLPMHTRLLAEWRGDPDLWPAVLTWAERFGLLQQHDRVMLEASMRLERDDARSLLHRVEMAALVDGRPELVNASSKAALVAWAVEAGHLTVAQGDELWRVFGAAAMRRGDG